MLIRPATPADIPGMRSLEQDAATAAHWSEREYAALFASDAPRRLSIVATAQDETLLGYAIARCGSDEWEIENVVVAQPYRRRGIATELVRQIVQRAQAVNATSVLLEVRESNLAARQLYLKLGFTEVGRRAAYYRNPPDNALILRFSTQNL